MKFKQNKDHKKISLIARYESPAIVLLNGIVKAQAQVIRRATPHLTEDNRLVAPTPIIDPVIV